MSIKPFNFCKFAGDWLVSGILSLGLVLLIATGLGAQTTPVSPAENSAGQEQAPKFEVLEGTTGSGSKTVNTGPEEKPEFKIEVMTVPPVAENDSATGGTSAEGAVSNDDIAVGEDKTIRKPRVVTAAQKAKMTPEERAELERQELLDALEDWHYKTLANYDYNIISMDDPFIPIEQVRGRQELVIDQVELEKLPPILRMELNQLKLVAITVLSDRAGGALASFEDGAGSSYILRLGDRIGRNQGRIIQITPTQVTVEEAPRRGEQGSRRTEIKLSVTSTDGITRTSEM